MGWWPSVIVLAVGLAALAVVVALIRRAAAGVSRAIEGWRSDLQWSTPALRSGVARLRERRGMGGPAEGA